MDSGDNQTVGYGRPPIETRFKPGTSGNPRGRPRGVKSIGKLLVEALARRVTVQEGGRARKMRVQDIIVQGVVNDAARRNPQALKLLFALVDRYGQTGETEINPASLQADDQAIIASFLSTIQTQSENQADAARSPEASAGLADDSPSENNPRQG